MDCGTCDLSPKGFQLTCLAVMISKAHQDAITGPQSYCYGGAQQGLVIVAGLWHGRPCRWRGIAVTRIGHPTPHHDQVEALPMLVQGIFHAINASNVWRRVIWCFQDVRFPGFECGLTYDTENATATALSPCQTGEAPTSAPNFHL